MTNNERISLIKSALAPLNATYLHIEDQSHLHRGHAGAKDGRGHFALKIYADALIKKSSRIQQHQVIYQLLGDLMQTDIHALSIDILITNPAQDK